MTGSELRDNISSIIYTKKLKKESKVIDQKTFLAITFEKMTAKINL